MATSNGQHHALINVDSQLQVESKIMFILISYRKEK